MKVNLTKRVVVDGRDRYCPVAVAGNGRLKPDVVVVDGVEQRHPEGRYYIDWTVGGKRKRSSVGKSATTATARQLRKETELKAQSQGITLAEPGETTGTDLHQAVAEFLADTKLVKKPKTLSAYSTSLSYFLESCARQYVEHIDRRDMLKFAAYLRDQKHQAARSVYNKFNNVMSFLKVHKANGIVSKRDWPRFTQEDVEIYSQVELSNLAGVSNDAERLWWDFFLMTGMREQEVIYTTWRDVDIVAGTVSVRHKPEYGWTPKAYKEREIPIPWKLQTALLAVQGTRGLVFPTESGKPKMDFLHCLKGVVRRGKLREEDYYLHKFRATFATLHLQNGVDLRTVQEWMGHVDIESTMRYLKPARHETVRDRVNSTFQ